MIKNVNLKSSHGVTTRCKRAVAGTQDQNLPNPIDFNSFDNGIMAPKKSLSLDVKGHGNHPQYSDKIRAKLTGIDVITGNNIDSYNKLRAYISSLRNKIESDVMNGGMDINTLDIGNL